MSCKHEFIQEEWIVEVCKKCDKLRAQTVFEDELAAANARIAEFEYKLMAQTETALQEIARREQAEAQCNEMEVVNTELQAQNKLMREALEEIAESKLQTIDWAMKRWIDCRVQGIAKAALEEK